MIRVTRDCDVVLIEHGGSSYAYHIMELPELCVDSSDIEHAVEAAVRLGDLVLDDVHVIRKSDTGGEVCKEILAELDRLEKEEEEQQADYNF